jgi:hypothetical protein
MTEPLKPTSPAQTQRDRFIEAARELGCDESEEAFAEKVRKVAKAPVPAKVSGGKDLPERLKKVSQR